MGCAFAVPNDHIFLKSVGLYPGWLTDLASRGNVAVVPNKERQEIGLITSIYPCRIASALNGKFLQTTIC